MEISSDMEAAARSVMPDVVSVYAKPLAGGSSAFVAVLELESVTGDRRRVVFRQHADRAGKEHVNGVASKEFHLTQELAGGGFEVARPLALCGNSTLDGPWLVSEWIDGTTEVSDDDVNDALSQMAGYLARLHQIGPGHLNVPGLEEIEDPIDALRGYLLDDDTGRLVERVVKPGIERHPNPSALLHGDFWPGNVMFGSGRLVAVLDWEDAKWGDPLADLACARVEIACAYGVDESDRFTASYLAACRQLNTHDLPLWEMYVSATALSAMHRWGLSRTDEARRRRATGQFLSTALERLDATAPRHEPTA